MGGGAWALLPCRTLTPRGLSGGRQQRMFTPAEIHVMNDILVTQKACALRDSYLVQHFDVRSHRRHHLQRRAVMGALRLDPRGECAALCTPSCGASRDRSVLEPNQGTPSDSVHIYSICSGLSRSRIQDCIIQDCSSICTSGKELQSERVNLCGVRRNYSFEPALGLWLCRGHTPPCSGALVWR